MYKRQIWAQPALALLLVRRMVEVAQGDSKRLLGTRLETKKELQQNAVAQGEKFLTTSLDTYD